MAWDFKCSRKIITTNLSQVENGQTVAILNQIQSSPLFRYNTKSLDVVINDRNTKPLQKERFGDSFLSNSEQKYKEGCIAYIILFSLAQVKLNTKLGFKHHHPLTTTTHPQPPGTLSKGSRPSKVLRFGVYVSLWLKNRPTTPQPKPAKLNPISYGIFLDQPFFYSKYFQTQFFF